MSEQNLDKGLVYETLFNSVADSDNWKNPTRPFRTHDEQRAKLMREAIVYMVGGAELSEKNDQYVVTSRGYYHYIGA